MIDSAKATLRWGLCHHDDKSDDLQMTASSGWWMVLIFGSRSVIKWVDGVAITIGLDSQNLPIQGHPGCGWFVKNAVTALCPSWSSSWTPSNMPQHPTTSQPLVTYTTLEMTQMILQPSMRTSSPSCSRTTGCKAPSLSMPSTLLGLWMMWYGTSWATLSSRYWIQSPPGVWKDPPSTGPTWWTLPIYHQCCSPYHIQYTPHRARMFLHCHELPVTYRDPRHSLGHILYILDTDIYIIYLHNLTRHCLTWLGHHVIH